MIMTEKRFEEVYTQGKLKVTKVIRDNETGVLFDATRRLRSWINGSTGPRWETFN